MLHNFIVYEKKDLRTVRIEEKIDENAIFVTGILRYVCVCKSVASLSASDPVYNLCSLNKRNAIIRSCDVTRFICSKTLGVYMKQECLGKVT